MPWKNGGGETREIVVHPAHATLDDMQWRISMASVTTDGPFSLFPGIDRTLCVLQGRGLQLDFDARRGSPQPHELHIGSEPFSFAADQPVEARLLDGGIVDLNVMTRRDTHTHSVQRLEVSARYTLLDVTPTTVLFCEQGNVSCQVGNAAPVLLAEHDALVLDGAEEPAFTLTGAPAGRLLMIRIIAVDH